ncbi:MAG TPA: TlpA disulfide reductase family protein [Candidatus Binatia bacterium]|nr:TlpA disulfide reductase family protein [Candidatus Binatia bacterium]
MANRFWPAVILLLTLQFCQVRSPLAEAEKMAGAYAACTERSTRLEEELQARLKSTPPGRYREKVVSALGRVKNNKKAELEELLRSHEETTSSDELELLRSKILIEIGRIREAEQTLDRLSLSRSDLVLEATLQKVVIYLFRGRIAEAQVLFKEIEAKLKKDRPFYDLCLAFAFTSPEAKVREEYSRKFIAFQDLPAVLQPRKADVYANLAALAGDEGQTEKARGYLEKALALNNDPEAQAELRSAWTRSALIGLPAPSLRAENWFNSAPLTLAGLKGRVLAVNFWAPWCPSCRDWLPALLDEWKRFKDQGFLVIGYTKLYAGYGDGTETRKKVGAAEEMALIKKYLDQNGISWPTAVGTEGLAFDTYAVSLLPMLVLIDRRGQVAHIKTGAGAVRNLGEQIKSLLAEK